MATATTLPAFVCENGILTVVSPQLQVHLRWSPSPLAEHKIPGSSKWAPFWPAFRLLRPKTDAPANLSAVGELTVPFTRDDQIEAREAAFHAFCSQIQDDITGSVAPFCSHQWQLLCLLQAAPSAMDLVKVNPVLGYCLANNAEFRGTKETAAATQAVWYSHRKQKIILEWLGFDASESLARLFRKIPPEAAYPSLMRRFRSMLSRDKQFLSLMGHLPKITRGVLELMTNEDTAGLAAAKLLHEVAERENELSVEQASDILLGALRLQREMGVQTELRPFTSIAQVLRFQEAVDAEYRAFQARQEEARLAAEREAAEVARRNRAAREELAERRKAKRAEVLRRPFSKPPIPGTAEIIPLLSAAELAQEGREQRNCVGGYAESVQWGKTYIYKVISPERATLSIIKGPDGCWRRSELKKAGNKIVSAATINAVERWLNQHRFSL